MIQDLATPIRIAQPLLLNEMHLAAKLAFQLVGNVDEVEQAPTGPVLELHEDVDVACGGEI